MRKYLEEKSLLSIEDLSRLSAAKAKLIQNQNNPEIRSRSFCLPGVDVAGLKNENGLSARVISGKVGDIGEEANIIKLDLGLPYFLNGIAIVFSSSTKSRYAFKVQTSFDGKNWQLLYDFTQYHTSNRVDLTFDARVIRFISLSEGLITLLI